MDGIGGGVLVFIWMVPFLFFLFFFLFFCSGDRKEKGNGSCRSGGDDDDGDERSFEFESKQALMAGALFLSGLLF